MIPLNANGPFSVVVRKGETILGKEISGAENLTYSELVTFLNSLDTGIPAEEILVLETLNGDYAVFDEWGFIIDPRPIFQ